MSSQLCWSGVGKGLLCPREALREAAACYPVFCGLPAPSPRLAQGWDAGHSCGLGQGKAGPGLDGVGSCRQTAAHTRATPGSDKQAREPLPEPRVISFTRSPKGVSTCKALATPSLSPQSGPGGHCSYLDVKEEKIEAQIG